MIAHHQAESCLDPIGLSHQPLLETARLLLRRPGLKDADAIASVLGQHETARMLPSLPFPYDRQDALEWLLPRASGVLPGWTFAITRAGNDTMIGAVTVERRAGRWVLGYWLAPEFRGQGLMGEALDAVVHEFFEELPAESLQASVLADNPASFALQARLGFRITGCRDVYCNARGAMKTMLETVLHHQDLPTH